MPRYDTSIARYEDAKEVLAGGVSSNFRYHTAPVPLAIERGEGAYVWDADGNRYVDFVLGNGPAFLGHNPAPVLDAVRATLEHGQAFTSVHQAEIKLARHLTEVIPCAERVRFDVSGTLAAQVAIRLARAHTGRAKVLKFEGHYHGWADNLFASMTPALNELGPREHHAPVIQSLGQPASAVEELLVLPCNDLETLSRTVAAHGDDIAAIVLEPIACNTGVIEPAPGYLQGLRALCDAHGIVLIFDEVITGFRVALGGAQARYGVVPDIAVFAKAAAAGFALSVVAGRRDIMQGVTSGVVHGGTYNAITSSIAACQASVDELGRDDGAIFQRVAETGERLIDGLNEIGRRRGLSLHSQGVGQVLTSVFTESPPLIDYRGYKASDETMRVKFVKGLQDRGVRTTVRGTWFMSSVHSDADIDFTLDAADAAAAAL